jgi:hypothetical protein
MKIISSTLMQPAFVFTPFLIVGAIVWIFLPGEYLRIRSKEEITISGILYLFAWYSVLIISALMGRASPFRLKSRAPSAGLNFNIFFYWVTSILAFLGCVSLLSSLGGFSSIALAILDQQVNTLKESLYDNYSSGFLTFRYLTSIAAAMAVYNITSRRRSTLVLDIVNILMLVIVALVSARILIFQTVVFYLFLKSSSQVRKEFKPIRSLILFAAVFLILVGFTYSRSAGTYKYQLNIENPIMVTFVEFSRYIAMPIQVTVGVSNIVTTSKFDNMTDIQPMYLAPSFMHPNSLKLDNSGGVGSQWYYSHVDVPSTLTTNSAFAAAVGHLGHFVFIGVPLIIFMYSMIFYLVYRSGDLVLTLYGGVILYAFFELWRTYYFSAGSFVFFNILLLSYVFFQISKGALVLTRITSTNS